MSGAVIIQQTNGEQIDLSVMIQSAVANAIVEVDQQKRTQSKHGRSDRGSGSEYLGHILRTGREEIGHTQSELARAAGVHPTTISKIEDGERGISLVTLAKLAPHISELSLRDILSYYAEGGDVGGQRDEQGLHPGAWREAGGPEQEHPVPELRGVTTQAEGGNGAGS